MRSRCKSRGFRSRGLRSWGGCTRGRGSSRRLYGHTSRGDCLFLTNKELKHITLGRLQSCRSRNRSDIVHVDLGKILDSLRVSQIFSTALLLGLRCLERIGLVWIGGGTGIRQVSSSKVPGNFLVQCIAWVHVGTMSSTIVDLDFTQQEASA